MTVNVGDEERVILRPGIVHRLDRETSGVLIIVKNQETFEHLKKQFKNHRIEKTYRSFVYGFVKDPVASLKTGKRGIISAPIGRSPSDVRMWTAGRGVANKETARDAVTEYIVLKRFVDDEELPKDINHQFSYVEAYPKTGRTHQIRVHMRYINHPVVSDSLYRASKEKGLGFDRLALHAMKISFYLEGGQKIEVEAPLPDDFLKVIKKYNLN
jgi:23S rRNA pseudouridine1911/1915/1917 synthase